MVKIIIPFLLVISLFWSCQNRRNTTPTQTDTSPTATTPNTADSSNATTDPDSLASGKNNAFLIYPGGAGIVKINMPVTTLKKMMPPDRLKEVTIPLEGENYKAYEIKNQAIDAQAALLVEERCQPACQVWRIQVLDSAYHTTEGIRIGASLGEVKKHYPISYLGFGETGFFAVSASRNISFVLDTSALPAQQVQSLNLKNVPNHLPVKRILIF